MVISVYPATILYPNPINLSKNESENKGRYFYAMRSKKVAVKP